MNRFLVRFVGVALLASLLMPSAAAAEPLPPRLRSVTRTSDGIDLRWTVVDGAVGYNIYRSGVSEPEGNGYLTTITGGAVSFYTDSYTAANVPTYFLTAFDEAGNLSGKSNAITAASGGLGTGSGLGVGRNADAADSDVANRDDADLSEVGASTATEDAAAFAQPCDGLDSFATGCLTSGGSWNAAFTRFAAEAGISTTNPVGARVQYFPNPVSGQPLDRMVYIVGPYLGATDDSDDFDSVVEERAGVERIAPVMAKLDQALALRGVSIVYIGFGNFEDAQQPVSQRVVATSAAIRSFETERSAVLEGKAGPSALIGVSLGGVVGKIALSELETDGFDHGIDTYLSFDSPHWGAHTPLGLQRVPIYLEQAFSNAGRDVGWLDDDDRFGFDDPVDLASDGAATVARLTLKSPVAQDLLAYNLAYPDWQSPNIGYLRDRYQDLPRHTSRNVAIASGATDGTRPVLAEKFFEVNTGPAGNDELNATLWLDSRIPALDDTRIFEGELSYQPSRSTTQLNLSSPGDSPENNADEYVINDYERAPCSFTPGIVDQTVDLLNAQLSATMWNGFSFSAQETRACFIPTFSAVIGDSSPGAGTVVGATAFDHVIGDSLNKQHLQTSATMNDQIVAEFHALFPLVGGPVETATVAADAQASAIFGVESDGAPEPSDPIPPRRMPTGPASIDPTPGAIPTGPATIDTNLIPTSPPEPELAAPADFTVTTYSKSAIAVDWDQVDGATRYVLTRNGSVVYDSKGNGFWDHDLEPGSTYSYALVAMHGDVRSATQIVTRATDSK